MVDDLQEYSTGRAALVELPGRVEEARSVADRHDRSGLVGDHVGDCLEPLSGGAGLFDVRLEGDVSVGRRLTEERCEMGRGVVGV